MPRPRVNLLLDYGVLRQFLREHHVQLLVAEEPPRGWIAAPLWRRLAETLIRRVNCPVVIGGPGFLRSAPPATPPIRPMLRRRRWPSFSSNGFDTRGYLDYRGARVVGAWRWVPEYGFGVTAEVDHAAAYPAASVEPS